MEQITLHRIFKAFKRPEFGRRPEYRDIEKPDAAFFAYDENGMYYRVNIASGATCLRIGSNWLPVGGCPFPERLIYARTLALFARNQTFIFRTLVWVAAIWALQTLIYATPGNLFGSDLMENLLTVVVFWLNTCLITLTGLAVIAIALSSFRSGLTVQMPWYASDDAPPALGAGSFDVAPDILVAHKSESETPGEFARRLSDAVDESKPGQYVIVAAFRSPIFFVKDGSEQLPIPRNKLPFPLPEYSDVPDAKFLAENFEQYSGYLSAFCEAFKPWAFAEKIKNSGAPISTYIRNSMLFFLLISAPLSGFSQISKQVSDYLGAARYTSEAPNEQVLFKFEKKAVYREGDGVKSFEQLLTSVPGGSFNDNADLGKLSFVKVGADMIPAVKKRSQMSAGGTLTPIESAPVGEMSDMQKMANGTALIDSAAFAAGLRHTSERASFYKSYFWMHYGRSLVDWIMSGLEFLSMLIIGVLTILIVIGLSAKKNGHLGSEIEDLQRWASRNAYKINLALFVVLMSLLISYVFFNEWGFIEGLFCIVFCGTAGYKLINAMSPDGVSRIFSKRENKETGIRKY